MTDMVNHPPHYKPLDGIDFDCIDVTRHMTFDVGNAVKYVWRADRKNGLEDLKKARWYLKDAIAHQDSVIVSHLAHVHRLLKRLRDAQTDENRRWFFDMIRIGKLHVALSDLEAMISDAEQDDE